MRDPYEVLGVARSADAKAIRAAYRKLAKRWHPDLNPGDAEAEKAFKEISAANELLSDAEKRRRFDAGEIDAAGQERQPERPSYRGFADGAEGERYRAWGGGEDYADLGSMFSDLFGRGGRAQGTKLRGGDVSYVLRVGFLEAANGARKRVTMPDGRSLDIAIPAGVADRQTLRLAGQGQPGLNGGPAGDAYIEVHLEPHAFFTRKDPDIHLELPVSLAEAVLGGKVRVPTVAGTVSMTLPKGSNTGRTLRLPGKGLPIRNAAPGEPTHGDQYVHLKVVLPREPDAELERFVAEWAAAHPYDPRDGMEA